MSFGMNAVISSVFGSRTRPYSLVLLCLGLMLGWWAGQACAATAAAPAPTLAPATPSHAAAAPRVYHLVISGDPALFDDIKDWLLVGAGLAAPATPTPTPAPTPGGTLSPPGSTPQAGNVTPAPVNTPTPTPGPAPPTASTPPGAPAPDTIAPPDSLGPGQLWKGKTAGGSSLVIENHSMPDLPAALLMFSDHPEKVSEAGLLYEGGLIRQTPVRFQYYHQGKAGSPLRYLVLVVKNPGKKPARLWIIRAEAGPHKGAYNVGHESARRFLDRLQRRSGILLDLPAESQQVISRVALPPDQVATGLYQFCVWEGGPVQLAFFAVDNPDAPLELSPLLTSAGDTHARGTYRVPDCRMGLHYVAGAGEQYLTLGDTPLADLFAGPALKGLYGVRYFLDLCLENPTASPHTVRIFFQPRGGGAAGTFLSPRGILQAGPVKALVEVPLTTVTIPARSGCLFPLVTMPEGASSLPIRLIVRPAVP